MKFILIITILIFASIPTPLAFAESNASVVVENNVSGNQNINSNTEIRIETNGNVTEYKSTEPNQNIEVNASNNESTIKVDGELVSETASVEGKMSDNQKNNNYVNKKDFEDDSSIFVQFFSKIFSFLDFL